MFDLSFKHYPLLHHTYKYSNFAFEFLHVSSVLSMLLDYHFDNHYFRYHEQELYYASKRPFSPSLASMASGRTCVSSIFPTQRQAYLTDPYGKHCFELLHAQIPKNSKWDRQSRSQIVLTLRFLPKQKAIRSYYVLIFCSQRFMASQPRPPSPFNHR